MRVLVFFHRSNFVYCVAFAVQQILEADFKRVGFPVLNNKKPQSCNEPRGSYIFLFVKIK
jgi:hypothetical protein